MDAVDGKRDAIIGSHSDNLFLGEKDCHLFIFTIKGEKIRYYKDMANRILKSAIIFSIMLLVACGADKNLKRGEKHLALGEYYDAATEFKSAYSKTPSKEREKRGQIAKKMAFCYEKVNFTQKAIAAYRNVIRYKQDDGQTHLSFARQLLKNANYKEAVIEFQQALDSMPDNVLARNGLESAQSAPSIKEQGSR